VNSCPHPFYNLLVQETRLSKSVQEDDDVSFLQMKELKFDFWICGDKVTRRKDLNKKNKKINKFCCHGKTS